MTPRLTALLALAALSLLLACGSGPSERVGDDLMAGVSAEKLKPVHEAEAQRDKAMSDLAKVKGYVEKQANEVRLGQSEVDEQETKVDQAKIKVEMAAQEAKPEPVAAANEALRLSSAKLEAAERKVGWKKLTLDHAEARQSVAEARVELAESRVEVAKARALEGSDKPEAKKLSVATFELQVGKYKEKVADAEQDASKVKIDAEEAERLYKAAQDAADALERTVTPEP